MIDTIQIYQHVTNRHPIMEEVFDNIKNSDSSAIHRAAIKSAKDVCTKMLNSLPTVVRGDDIINDICERTSIENFLIFLELEESNELSSWQLKIWSTEPFLSVSLRIACAMFKLDYSSVYNLRKTDRDSYNQITKGILLAGIYLNQLQYM
jgi:hypothetical protein